MWIPIDLAFDGGKNVVSCKQETVHVPKIYQGAPYQQPLRVKHDDGTYRDWTSYDEIRMQLRLSQNDEQPLLTLSKTGGQFIVTSDTLTIALDGADTADLDLAFSPGSSISEVEFVHDIELLVAGEVIERFAQGNGFIVTATTRSA